MAELAYLSIRIVEVPSSNFNLSEIAARVPGALASPILMAVDSWTGGFNTRPEVMPISKTIPARSRLSVVAIRSKIVSQATISRLNREITDGNLMAK